jgi:hypothetical protein
MWYALQWWIFLENISKDQGKEESGKLKKIKKDTKGRGRKRTL